MWKIAHNMQKIAHNMWKIAHTMQKIAHAENSSQYAKCPSVRPHKIKQEILNNENTIYLILSKQTYLILSTPWSLKSINVLAYLLTFLIKKNQP